MATSKTQDMTPLVGDFDLLAAAKRQSTFLYQVQPICASTNDDFSSDALKRYHQFLQLVPHHAKEQEKTRADKEENESSSSQGYALVPTMEIDLIWHTHMTGATPAQYRNDCHNICGMPFHHDDSLDDRRQEGGANTVGFQKTAELWHKIHKDDSYLKRGGYRGEPPLSWWPSRTISMEVTNDDTGTTSSVAQARATTGITWYDFAARAEAFAPAWNVDGYPPKSEFWCCLGWNNDVRNDPSFATAVKQDDRWRFVFVLLLVTCVCIIAAGIGISLQDDSNNASDENYHGYVCGGTEPTLEEIRSRGVPVCVFGQVTLGDGITYKIHHRHMCLKAGENMNDPPVWCHTNIVDAAENGNDPSYWLYWSPCTNCGGTAWRMGTERSDTKSFYKSFTPVNRPTASDTPPASYVNNSLPWLHFENDKEWVERKVDIWSCDGKSAGGRKIPDSCYDAMYHNNENRRRSGPALMISAFVGFLCLIFVQARRETKLRAANILPPRRGGGGCGGGGGGCGGGGGGCGGGC